MLDYTKPEPITLKNHPEFTERWLTERIEEDTTILGLGELIVIERERQQDKAGRLDFLLADTDPEANQRYEVEIQLGATDESHIIRCIEYWDIERRRYPGYDHCAVIVAEDVTSRFLNILGLFAGNIPLIAIQLNALKVGSQIVLDFVRVLDRISLRKDDPPPPPVTDRAYWQGRVPTKMIEIVDECLQIINERATTALQLNYNKYYIGLQDNTRSRNFIHFKPKNQFTHILAEVADKQPWVDRLDEAGLAANPASHHVRVTVSPKDMTKHRDLLAELLHRAVEEYQQ